MRLTRSRRWAAAVACGAMVFASMITGGTGGVAAAPAGEADLASRQEMATSALQAAFRTADSRLIDGAARQAHQTVADRASRAPAELGSGSVVFDSGMTTAELAGFVTRHGVDLYAVEVKVPVRTGEVHTMWFNDVARTAGTPEEKLTRVTGAARLRYFQQADAAPATQRAALRELAEGEYRVYRAEVVGTNARLAALVDAPSVSAVLPDPGDSKVSALRDAQASVRAVEASGAEEIRLGSGASKTGEPVVTNTGQDCYWQSAGVLACEAGDRGAVSGDSSLDAALPRTDDSLVAGTNRSDPESSTRDDSSLWVGCNNSSDNQACPNDNTYRPHGNTGGAQAFGVSITNYRTNDVLYICYAEWVPYPGSEDGSGYWQYYCYPYAVITANFTFGAARWDSRWGTQQTTIAAAQTSRPISTLAYKYVDGLQPCVVQQFLATAECSRALQNSVFVPSTGMEDELLMGNPACSPTPVLGRKGTPEDRNNGCFYPSYAASTLPAAFLDTTFGDGQQYNLAVGSSNPALLVEGRVYSSYAEFWAYGNNNMIGQTAFHSVAVDSRVNNAAVCQAYNNADPFCYFPVDASRISPIVPFS